MRLKSYQFCICSCRGFHHLYNSNKLSCLLRSEPLWGTENRTKMRKRNSKSLRVDQLLFGIIPRTSAAVCSCELAVSGAAHPDAASDPGRRPPAWLMQGVPSLNPCSDIKSSSCTCENLQFFHLCFFCICICTFYARRD